MSFPERACAAVLQGLVNKESPQLYLDYGIYDDPTARRTNEDFMDDEIWFGKYRQLLGNQDQHNLIYYRDEHGFSLENIPDLSTALHLYREYYQGLVIWDENQPDTLNIAIMLASQENYLPVTRSLLDLPAMKNLNVLEDLRGRWKNRVEIYQWAFENFFLQSKPGFVACLEPGWKRTEFIDYIVQHKIFVYNLSSQVKGLGSTILMLLAFGPPFLRELIFAFRLDKFLRNFALSWMAKRSPEVALGNKIQRSVKPINYPTIFGWHTCRDDELAFMLQLSTNGLRLVPSHLAGNFSFHSSVKPLGFPKLVSPPVQELDNQGIYLTFTLSDGDQLMMMHTGELGNWRSPSRGEVAFNWEIQPLLIEIAPALLEKYFHQAKDADCLIAGPSGAGYIIPPLAPNLPAYMQATVEVCAIIGIQVVTTYIADPPKRVLRDLAKNKGNLIGYLAGYAVVTRAPYICKPDLILIANQSPTVEEIWLPAEDLLNNLQKRISEIKETPAFIGVHLFAYRTTIADVAKWAKSNEGGNIHIVRADTFLQLASQNLKTKENRQK